MKTITVLDEQEKTVLLQARDVLRNYCNSWANCVGCPLTNLCDTCRNNLPELFYDSVGILNREL